jgi:hypothetical protein
LLGGLLFGRFRVDSGHHPNRRIGKIVMEKQRPSIGGIWQRVIVDRVKIEDSTNGKQRAMTSDDGAETVTLEEPFFVADLSLSFSVFKNPRAGSRVVLLE